MTPEAVRARRDSSSRAAGALIPPGGDVFTADRDEFRDRLREAGYPD